MKNRLVISTLIRKNNLQYQIFDKLTKKICYCNVGELNQTIWKMLGVG